MIVVKDADEAIGQIPDRRRHGRFIRLWYGIYRRDANIAKIRFIARTEFGLRDMQPQGRQIGLATCHRFLSFPIKGSVRIRF
jgi:hypothetical protein